MNYGLYEYFIILPRRCNICIARYDLLHKINMQDVFLGTGFHEHNILVNKLGHIRIVDYGQDSMYQIMEHGYEQFKLDEKMRKVCHKFLKLIFCR